MPIFNVWVQGVELLGLQGKFFNNLAIHPAQYYFFSALGIELRVLCLISNALPLTCLFSGQGLP